MRQLNGILLHESLGKELMACQTAKDSFLEILNIVGGSNEKKRGEQLLKSITIMPDLTKDQEDSVWSDYKLRHGKKIQKRSFTIFSFGLYHKALTVTANKGAIEAAKMQVNSIVIETIRCYLENITHKVIFLQGISIPVIIHEARALTEQKQQTAKQNT